MKFISSAKGRENVHIFTEEYKIIITIFPAASRTGVAVVMDW